VRTRLSQGVRARQDELGKTEAALEQERQEVAELESSLRTTLERRPALADDPAGFAENETAIASLQAELLRRREYVLPRREDDLRGAQANLAHAEWDDSGKALVAAQKRRRERSAKVATRLSELCAEVAELAKERTSVAELEAEFRARIPAGVDDWAFPSEARDEPEWPDLGDLLEVLSAGPKRPLATEAAGRARAAAESERAARSEVAQAIREALREGSFVRVENLRGNRRPLIAEIAERQAREFLADISPSSEEVLDMSGAALQRARDQKRSTIERRLERIRELAADKVEAAA
jgi:hypothetical protein